MGGEKREMLVLCNATSGYNITVPVQGESSIASFPKIHFSIKRQLACFAYNLIKRSIFYIAKWNLFCGNQYKVSLGYTAFQIGGLSGSIFISPFSDR